MMTPARFSSLLERKRMADQHAWFRTGTIAATIINYSMCRERGSKALNAMDFVPAYLLENEKEIPFEKLPIEEQRKLVRAWKKKEIDENDNLTPEQRKQLNRGSKTVRTTR